MQLSNLFALSLAPLAMAAQQATMDGPAIKAFISTMQGQISAIDKIVTGMTDANIATQTPLLITNINSINEALITGSTSIKSSKALGVFEIGGLASSASPLIQSSLGLMNNVISKRAVLVQGKQVEPVAVELKKLQKGVVALQDAMGGQLPPSIAAQLPKVAVPGLANLDVKKFTDMMFDVGIAVFKGEDAKVEVTGSTIWPLLGGKAVKPAKRGVEFSA